MRTNGSKLLLLLCLPLGLGAIACADDGASPPDSNAADAATSDVGGATDAGDAGTDVAADPAVGPLVASCRYRSAQTDTEHCRDYAGGAWTAESAAANCAALPTVESPTFAEAPCDLAPGLGTCAVGDFGGEGMTIVIGGSDPTTCAAARTGCEAYAGGSFEPAEVCDPASAVEPPLPPPGAFVQPYLDCREPLDGEDGAGPGGSVCTNVLISACTEAGRDFVDYASCDVVRTQRPYYAIPKPYEAAPDDPRLEDADYVREAEWVASQVSACACTCCHSTQGAPRGATADWWIDGGPLWMDTVSDSGLAMFAGLVDSSSLGAYPAELNNGFDRTRTGLPTTDTARLRAFVLQQLERRGIAEDEAAEYSSFGGPFQGQISYVPTACAPGDGFDADGNIRWPGVARYVYVLEPGSANPSVPPDQDLPEGTLWRLDVPADTPSLRSGIPYGQVPAGAFQRFPFEQPAPELEAGREYYIYVLADVAFPVLRCLSTWPG